MQIPTDTPLEAKERLNLMKLMDEGTFRIPKREVDENLLLGTWNIQQFSEKKSWRAIKYIADIIERFDIVAIQELKSDLRGLSKLLHVLPGEYRLLVSDVTGNSERFAFIYDERTVKATGLVAEITLDIDTQKHVGFQLHRIPYCASFRAGRFDFTVVSVHIFQSDAAFREREIQVLAQELVKLSKKQHTKVVDRDFFVVGDFNIDEEGDKFFKALTKEGFQLPPPLDNIKTNFSRTKTFDKISWVNRPDFKFNGRANVVPFPRVVFQDKDPKGGKGEISDHLPLWAEFRINELTQQLEQIISR